MGKIQSWISRQLVTIGGRGGGSRDCQCIWKEDGSLDDWHFRPVVCGHSEVEYVSQESKRCGGLV